MASNIIVTATDDHYALLARDLISSIQRLAFDVPFEIGVLDTGLSEENRQWFLDHKVHVEKTVADIDFPNRVQWEIAKPGVRTLTARLFMRRYFPGFENYMWMDSDVWVQTPEAINTFFGAVTRNPVMHICCELDRSYRPFFDHAVLWHVFRDWYQTNYGEEIASFMTLRPMLNAGVWCMAKNDPIWDAWPQLYAKVLQGLSEANQKTFMADQLGLNILLYKEKMPHVVMPAHYNWLTFYALPMLDQARGLYVEPNPPYRPISQFHLTRPNKAQKESISCVEGGVVERSLLFSDRGAS